MTLHPTAQTRMIQLWNPNIPEVRIHAKLESENPTGSVKDRAARYVVEHLLRSGAIAQSSALIESSSGNMGIALAAVCRELGLRFTCVIDPNIAPCNEARLLSLGASVHKVSARDGSSGYLRNRIGKVREVLRSEPGTFWINQYANPLVSAAYYNSVGEEICDAVRDVDYVFLAVSSGGTVTGISNKIKERRPQAVVVAVDVCGSVIFGQAPAERFIPGIGAGMRPTILDNAQIDAVVHVKEAHAVKMCHELRNVHNLWVGGSSGAVWQALEQYFSNRLARQNANAVVVFADRGDNYLETIYNTHWVRDTFGCDLVDCPEYSQIQIA